MALTLLNLSEARRALPARRTMNPSNMTSILGGGGVGGFAAAKVGRLTADWSTVMRSADQELFNDLRKLRARSRERAVNSPIAAKFTQMLRTNVVGAHGVQINFKVEKQRKRGESDYDEATNETLRKAWRKWCKRKYCTVHGRYTFKDVLNLCADALARDGDFLVRRVYVDPKTTGNPFGFSLQLIDADQLNDSMNRQSDAKNPQIRMGVQVDSYQKPTGYWIYQGNPYETSFANAKCQLVPASEIYHVFIPRRVGQTRGYPLLAPVLWDINMLDKYFDAELTAARVGAQIFGAIEQQSDDAYEGDGENTDGTARLDLENGTLAVLAPGQSLKNATPEHPTAAFSPFVERSLRLIASGLGVAYHELGNDLAGVNYSSGRLGVLEERDYYMELQRLVVEALVQPVYEDWVKPALLNKALDLPYDPDRYTDDDAIQFMPRRWAWVDPLKDVQSSTEEIQNGLSTHEQVLSAHGKDWRAVFRQIKQEQDYADELGIQLGTDIRGDAMSEVNSQVEGQEPPEPGEEPTTPAKKPEPKPPTKPKPTQ